MNVTNFTKALPPASACSRLALAAFLSSLASYGAQAVTPAEFSPNGAGGAVTIGALDWAPGAALITNQDGGADAIPIAPSTTDKQVQVLAHGALISATDPGGDPVGLGNLNIDYEVTFIVSNGVFVDSNALGTEVLFALDPSSTNFFEIHADNSGDWGGSTKKANSLSGEGYDDGPVILSGQLVELSGNFVAGPGTDDLDKSSNGNDWPGVTTVLGEGSQQLGILVQSVDKDYFPSGVDIGTILPFNNSQVTPFQQTNPSKSFDINTSGGNVLPDIGFVNGADGPDMLLQIDPNNSFEFLPPAEACRFTGGGENTSGISYSEAGEQLPGWDGSTAQGGIPLTTIDVQVKKGKKFVTQSQEIGGYVYTFGGQAGANTAGNGQVNGTLTKGEWQHNNHEGPHGLQFAFHVGTASSGPGTEIDAIRCTDPGNCLNARPAPHKQLNFEGIGEFSNFSVDAGFDGDGMWTFPGIKDVLAKPDCKNGNGPQSCNALGIDEATPVTYHFVEVHVEDLGEPGNWSQNGQDDAQNCPILPAPLPNGATGTGDAGNVDGNNPFGADIFGVPAVTDRIAGCDCADYYRITIYKGFVPEIADGEIVNTGDINRTDKIYEVWGYLEHGNFQIHPQTGFDLKN